MSVWISKISPETKFALSICSFEIADRLGISSRHHKKIEKYLVKSLMIENLSNCQYMRKLTLEELCSRLVDIVIAVKFDCYL